MPDDERRRHSCTLRGARAWLACAPLLWACRGGVHGSDGDGSSTAASTSSSSTAASADTTSSTAAQTTSGAESSSGTPSPAPTLEAIDPALGDTLGGVAVTLQGTALSLLTEVTVGGLPCTTLELVDDAHARCITAALPAGIYDVAVAGPDGSAVLAQAFEAWSPSALPGARVLQADAGVTLARTAASAPLWRSLAPSAPWHARDGAGLLAVGDRLLLLGGWDSGTVPRWGGAVTTNEVWASDDGGASWTALLAHDPAPPTVGAGARWGPRHTAGWLTADVAGVAHAYVIGGDIYDVADDVWRSPDGSSWTRVATDAPWGGRVLHMVANFDGALWVMGGQTDVADPSTALADVWRSDDGGATWQPQPDAPWPARGMVYGPVEHDGVLWIVGGGTYAIDSGDRSYFGDVWSFDGTQWTEVVADGDAPWSGRQYHNLFAWQGELWISSGWLADAANHNDVWHSPDGVTWTRAHGTAFAPGHADGVAVTAAGPVHASGNAFDTAVHRLDTATLAEVTAWAEQGPDGASLLPPDDDARPLWVAQAFAHQPGLWFDGTDARLLRAVPDPQPQGRSVFWIGQSPRDRTAPPSINVAQTVVGDSSAASRAQAGYDGGAIALVVTDAAGSWRAGAVTAAADQLTGATRLLGFTHALDGTVQAFVDGDARGTAASRDYDARFMAWDSLAAGYGGDARAQLLLGAVVVVPAVIDEATRARLLQWSRKWGVGSGP